MNDVGAIIVTYNSEAEIGPCLDAALPHVAEIVAVDNASRDGTVEQVSRRPAVRLIANPANLGFAAAVNQGFRALRKPFVLLLNPDATLLTGIEPLLAACNAPGVAVAAGKLVDERNRPQAGFSVRRFPSPAALSFEVLGLNRLWPGNPVNRRYRCLAMDLEAAADVEQPAGAFLLIRRDAWESLGGFDEQFHPLWFEDVDFLKRAKDLGFRIAYEPRAIARHQGGHSARKIPRERRQFYWYASLLRYCAKHFRPPGRWAVRGAVLLGSLLRMVTEVLLRWTLRPFTLYGRVIRLACVGVMVRPDGGAGSAPGFGAPVKELKNSSSLF